MSRLPRALQPAWPLVKKAHVSAARNIGRATRASARLRATDRTIPLRGTQTSRETVSLEPDACRLYVGGPGEELARAVPQGTPPDHWVFRRWANYSIPERYVLEMDHGTVIGNYSAHITRSGTLDYETSPYFGTWDWRDHPVYLRARLPQAEHFDGTLLSLAKAGSGDNYYHFLLDLLPRYGVFREAMPGTVPDAYYLNRRRGYQQQLLGMIGLDGVPSIEPHKHSAVRASTLLVPSIPNLELMAPHWTTTWLRTNLPPKELHGRPRRLYITRGNVRNTRRLTNEPELLEKLAPLGFTVFDPGAHSVQEQIDHFSAAEVIVAPHGAALSNLVFCSPGVRVLELFAPKYVNPCYWAIADNIEGSTYRYVVCGEDPRGPGKPMQGVLTDIVADIPTVLAELDALLS